MLANRDLFRELTDLNETFTRFFNQIGAGGYAGDQPWIVSSIPLDLVETTDGYVIKATLPGLNPEEIDVSISNHTLTIKGEIYPDWSDQQDLKFYLRERWFGKFQRSVTLPVKVNAEDIQANYEAGTLTLFLPKSEEVKPKRIRIQSSKRQEVLEGRVTNKDRMQT